MITVVDIMSYHVIFQLYISYHSFLGIHSLASLLWVMLYFQISDKMLSTEFVYLICQDRRSGRVVTLEDNRFKLMSVAQAAQIEPSMFSTFVNTVKNLLSLSNDTPPEPISQPSDTYSGGKSKYD